MENGYISPGGLFDKTLKSLLFDLIAVLFGQKDPRPYRLAYPFAEPGKSPRQDTLYLEPRSVLGIMHFLSQHFDVPKQDRESGSVEGGVDQIAESRGDDKPSGPRFAIKSQSERPNQAAVAVRYRDSWFYIDDLDLKTKETFSLLTQLFALQASAIPVAPPVLTLPVGQ